MSYVSQISGNNIGDESVREKIDDANTGLRRDVYHLANAVNVIFDLIRESETTTNFYTIKDAYKDFINSTDAATKKQYRSMLECVNIPNHAQDIYFTDTDGRNIL